jgi:hypothetical protein
MHARVLQAVSRSVPLPASRSPRYRIQPPRSSAGLTSVASAVGNRAFTSHLARCANASPHRTAGRVAGGACCEECAENAATANLLAGAVTQRRKAANHDNPSRCETIADSKPAIPAQATPKPTAPAAPAAPAAPVCPAGNRATKATACIQPVVIADDDGKNPTTAPSMAKVQEIWKKCCIDLTVKPTQTVKKTAYKTLDESPTATPTAEETSLFTDAGASTCIQVFVPTEFAQGGRTGKDISGGGGTYEGGGSHPKIVVVEGTLPEVVAHEVGHANGYLDHDANNTVMKPTGAHNVANQTAVSADVCTKARTGSALSNIIGVADCCQNPT